MARKKSSNTPALTSGNAESENESALARKSGTAELLKTIPGFVEASDFSLPEGAEINSMSPLVRPSEFPVGRVLVGKFTKIFETNPTPKKKGEGIEIVPNGSRVGIALPAVATLRTALKIEGEGKSATSEYIGRTIAVQLLPNKIPSKKGQDAWHFLVAIYPEIEE